jgi:hypothetical protein
MTASVSGTSCTRSGSIVVGGSGHSVFLTWSAPASGGVNPPQNLQGTASAADPEATVTETEPNGCITLVGGTDGVQTLYSGDTLNGTVDTYDYGGCVYWTGTTDLWEDLYGVQINSSGTYTFTLTYSSGPDLDLILVSLPSTVMNPPCGSGMCGITCSNPETFSVSLSPGLYLLCVNMASEGYCSGMPPSYASYTLSVSGGSSGPVLQGYNIYRATVDSASSYSQINGGLIPGGSTSYTDGSPPAGTVYYRSRAVYDSGTSDWSNTAVVVVGGGGCTVSCTASAPSTAETGDSVSFLATASPSGCSGSLSYSWSFGDGSTSPSQNPTHTYSAPNTYSWQLAVSIGGATCTRTGTIVVTSPVTPPAVYSMQMGNPFRISVSGANFQSGIRVFIGGTEWYNFVVKSSGSIVLKGGAALKSLVPKYSTREFEFRNPDGGECSITWGWP